MRFIIDHDLHIHSNISSCANYPDNTPSDIMKAAKNVGIKKIALTDHFWDMDVKCDIKAGSCGFDKLKSALPLPKDEEVEFLFGCEADVNYDMVVGVSSDKFDLFDIMLISLTHNHKVGKTIREEDNLNPERLSKIWISRIESLLNMDLPFKKIGLSHLTAAHIARESEEVYKKTLDLIDEDDMKRVFTLAAERSVGIELNATDMKYTEENKDRILRIYRVAKECGCKFFCGGDSHHPSGVEYPRVSFIENEIDELSLTEDDKWPLARPEKRGF